MQTIIISSAKLVTPKGRNAEGKHLEVSYSLGTKTFDVTCTDNPHEDLRAAFQRLGFHIGNMTEQRDGEGEIDVLNIEARGFSISGEGEKESVVLTGIRELSTGKVIVLNTPLQRLSDESDNAYEELAKLNEILNECVEEVRLYIEEGKKAAGQPELFKEEETKAA